MSAPWRRVEGITFDFVGAATEDPPPWNFSLSAGSRVSNNERGRAASCPVCVSPSRVDSPVFREVRAVIEAFLAVPALMGSLSRVDYLVRRQGRPATKRFPAVRARVGFLPRVDSPVRDQG